jgi:endonuclease/exonuclease/phosphatase family metal-dependent hydrolase
MTRLLLALLLLAVDLPAAEPVVIRVVSYNIRVGGMGMDGKRDLSRTAAVLRALEPDVVLLQEVDVNARRSGQVDVPRVLAEALGMRPHFAEAMPFQGGSYGCALLTRLPAGQGGVATLRFAGGSEPRVALAVPLRAGKEGPEFLAVSTHLDFRSAREVEPHARQLAAFLAADPRPSILGGDLNFEPGSAVLAALDARLARIPFEGDAATYPADKPTKRIDHFHVHPAARFQARVCRVIPEAVASDHRPILLEVAVRP